MKTLKEKIQQLKIRLASGQSSKVMIVGLGSVGLYLLDYLLSRQDQNLSVVVAGRNREKMESDVNIVTVGSVIRRLCRRPVEIADGCDLEQVDTIASCIAKHHPDIIVNTSRVFAGLKYGSISWDALRAYGIWSPLAIRYIRNLMEAVGQVDSNAIVINTSYPDVTIPWLKNAGKVYPDLGSGNLNHLIPRIRLAVSKMLSVEDFWNLDITLSTAHFHDVVISKEGQTESADPLLDIRYQGKSLEIDTKELYRHCRIAMPVDAKRNIMNASSDYELINGILNSLQKQTICKVHSPGAFGEMGGYPVLLDGSSSGVEAAIDESIFSLEEMRRVNRESLYLDGIQDISQGCLYYTDELVEKVRKQFGVDLPPHIRFGEIDAAADFLIEAIIKKDR